jgi:hypothetical protein
MMATPQDTLTVYKMGIAPLDHVDVPVGRMIVKLYPKIIPSMSVHERVHAFQVNKLALKDLPTNFGLVIDTFGAKLNESSTVKGILSNWRCFFQEHWMDFGHLSILSFHNSQGAQMDDNTTAANAQILLPIPSRTGLWLVVPSKMCNLCKSSAL